MKAEELKRVKLALLKELDVTLQRYTHQRLDEVINDLSIHYTDLKPDPSPDDVFLLLEKNRILRGFSAKPVQQLSESLDRIHDGTYGLCARCGRELAASILERCPTTSLCPACCKGSKLAASVGLNVWVCVV